MSALHNLNVLFPPDRAWRPTHAARGAKRIAALTTFRSIQVSGSLRKTIIEHSHCATVGH